jgi:hypothetical protein
MDPRDEAGFLGSAVKSCVSNSNFIAARRHLEAHPRPLQPVRSDLSSTALERTAALGVNAPDEAFLLLFDLVDALDENQRNQARRLIYDRVIQAPDPATAEPLLAEFAAIRELGREYRLLIWELLDAAKGEVTPPAPILAIVLPRWNDLDKDRREAFVAQAGSWLRNRADLRIPVARVLTTIPQLSAEEHAALADAIVDAERLEDPAAVGNRAELLTAGRGLSGRSRKARTRMEERLAALEDGTDLDRQVFALVRG